MVELAPCEALLTKNSYHPPPVAVNKTSPFSQATLLGAFDVKLPTGIEPTLTNKVEPDGEPQLFVK